MSEQGSDNSRSEKAADLNGTNRDTRPIIHPLYSDVDGSANLVIQNEDNVQFRLRSYYLKAPCISFGSMPTEDDGPTSSGADSTVPIDAKCEVFELLLQYLGGRDPSTTSENLYMSHEGSGSLRLMREVLELGERFGIFQLPGALSPVMDDHARTSMQVWYLFTFAAKIDFPLLASYALQHLGRSRCPEERIVDHRMLEDVPAPYLIPLVRNMTLFRQAGGGTDWKKVGLGYPHLEEDTYVSPIPPLHPSCLCDIAPGPWWPASPSSSEGNEDEKE